MRDIQDDIDEGADIIIIKPALAFLDILKTASWETDMPLCAYNVSGEYSMVKAAAANGWIDEKKIVMENMIGMKRAGAQMIITYHALDVAKWLREEQRFAVGKGDAAVENEVSRIARRSIEKNH